MFRSQHQDELHSIVTSLLPEARNPNYRPFNAVNDNNLDADLYLDPEDTQTLSHNAISPLQSYPVSHSQARPSLGLSLPLTTNPPSPSNPPTPKVWLIFGATGHMGRSICKAAIEHNDSVCCVGQANSDTTATMTNWYPNCPERYTGLLCDVRIRSTVQTAVQGCIDAFGRLDIVANCSGYGIIGACEDQDEFEINNQFETNFMGTLNIIQLTLPYFRQRRWGRYLIFSSTSGALGVPGLGPYCATKYAVEGLVESMLYEVERWGIKCTLLEPGHMRRDDVHGNIQSPDLGNLDHAYTTATTNATPSGADATQSAQSGDPHLPLFGHFRITHPSPPYQTIDSPANHARRILQWIGSQQPTSVSRTAELSWQLAHCQFPPLRLLLGFYAVDSVRDRLKSVMEEIEDWKYLHFPVRVLDYALNNTWPETVPAKGNALDNPVNKAWLQTCLEYPVMMHGLLYAASMQMSFVGDSSEEGPIVERIRFAHYSETIKQVYKHISTLEGPPPDALVLVVVTLAVHGRAEKEPAIKCHPKSPLHKLQFLHIYGSMHLALEHLPALMSLLQRKGGLAGVTTYGMAETLQLADIYFATLSCVKPHFSLMREPPSLLASGKLKLDPIAAALMSELLSGFKDLHPCPCGQDLNDALEWIREVTVGVDMFHRNVPGAPALYELAPSINTGQSKMLTLDATILSANSEDTSVVCICRMASLIYNDIVIFPCPEVQRVKIRAGGMLREALEYHFEQFDFRQHARVLLWATVLGSIATSFTPGQPWFLRRLQWQAWELGINDWPSLQSLCSKFLWWRPVCDEPGLRIWNEMVTQVSSVAVRRASD
ncbi:hypothetical protein DV736_g544, partial [Chaetothyriales sp. CBS 134916]